MAIQSKKTVQKMLPADFSVVSCMPLNSLLQGPILSCLWLQTLQAVLWSGGGESKQIFMFSKFQACEFTRLLRVK